MLDERAYDAFGSLRGIQFGSTVTGSGGPGSVTAAWGQEVLGPDPVGFGGQWGYRGGGAGAGLLLGHRLYSPGTGRFLTRDPIGYAGGVNLYGFVHNNPVTGRDPNGTDDNNTGYQYLGDVFRGIDEQAHAFQKTLRKVGDTHTYGTTTKSSMPA